MMEEAFIQALGAGADTATIFILWIVWKIERRVYKLELEKEMKNEATI